ncbi:MAG: hypothetical protein ACOX9R_17310 [Armatimonadota bacterium]|jgi:hypothetical protein
MHSEEDARARIYRTGPPRDRFLGVALLVVATWFAYQFIHADHLRPVDRPIMAAISALTFGGMGLFAILRGEIRALILDRDRLCIRNWAGLSRCFPISRLRRVVWSYRYPDGRWGDYDRGRAWLELEFTDGRAGVRTAVVDYAGRARHGEIEQFTRQLAVQARLSTDPRGDSLDSTDLPAAEITLRRRRDAHSTPLSTA